MARLEAELNAAGVIGDDGALTTGTKPFNVFARLVSGAMAQPEMAAANALLDGPAAARFLLACNRKENDEHWASDAEEWVGKASMAERHRFLLIKDLSWRWFNCLTFGIRGGTALADAVEMLEAMKAAALSYTRADGGWSTSVGLYLHCYPFNSVQALHLHIVDLAAVGPSYKHLSHKNLPLDAALEFFGRDERRPSPPPPPPMPSPRHRGADEARPRARPRARRWRGGRAGRALGRRRAGRLASRLAFGGAASTPLSAGRAQMPRSCRCSSKSAPPPAYVSEMAAAAALASSGHVARAFDRLSGGWQSPSPPSSPSPEWPRAAAAAAAPAAAAATVGSECSAAAGRAVGSALRAPLSANASLAPAPLRVRGGGGPRRNGRANRSDVGADGAGGRRAAPRGTNSRPLADRR